METPLETLKRIARGYREMPYGGAALHITSDGSVSNGIAIVARFPSDSQARKALKACGFALSIYGWKLKDE